jgi:hypothetical protein
MTTEQANTAFALVGELNICATAMDQYGNGRIAGVIRRTADLLERMIAEVEAREKDEVDG